MRGSLKWVFVFALYFCSTCLDLQIFLPQDGHKHILVVFNEVIKSGRYICTFRKGLADYLFASRIRPASSEVHHNPHLGTGVFLQICLVFLDNHVQVFKQLRKILSFQVSVNMDVLLLKLKILEQTLLKTITPFLCILHFAKTNNEGNLASN